MKEWEIDHRGGGFQLGVAKDRNQNGKLEGKAEGYASKKAGVSIPNSKGD
jgi:hypothetical protein